MKILWDDTKSVSNHRKHGVSFEEASAIFAPGTDRLEVYDQAHSGYEDRFLAMGMSRNGLVVVVFSEPREDVLRIISARHATKRETRRFAAFLRGEGS